MRMLEKMKIYREDVSGMFRNVSKELKRKIFKGIDKLDISMEEKMLHVYVILLYAEGLSYREISRELIKPVLVVNRALREVKFALDIDSLQEVEELHENNLGKRLEIEVSENECE